MTSLVPDPSVAAGVSATVEVIWSNRPVDSQAAFDFAIPMTERGGLQ